jgi:NAD(P)-dependent dehydrogenase (short-subunit alcohol dehydrogenase family)
MTRSKTNAAANGNGNGNSRHHNFKTLSSNGSKNGKPKPVLITGGAGFVGSNLAHRLLSEGHRVRLLDNLSRSGVERNLRWLIETHGDLVDIEVPDVRNLSLVKQAVKDASQVFHFAAQVAVTSSLVDPIEDFEINARGTLNLLEAVRCCDNHSFLHRQTRSMALSAICNSRVAPRATRLSTRAYTNEALPRTGRSTFTARTVAPKARLISTSPITRELTGFRLSSFA